MLVHHHADSVMNPLEVLADLSLEINGQPMRVTSEGQTIYLDVTDPLALRSLQESAGGLPRHAALIDFVRSAELRLEARYRGSTIAALGAGARPSRLARWAGIPGVEVRTGALSAAVARSRPVAAAGMAIIATLLLLAVAKRVLSSA